MSDAVAAVTGRADASAGLKAPQRLRVSASEMQTRLTHLLIAKSILEALFVAALAVGFHYLAFNPYFRGWVDVADATRVSGWALNEADHAAHIEVQLYVDGRFAASRVADLARADVLAAGRAMDERHGFSFDTPPLPDGEHEARVYAVHASSGGLRRTLQLIGRPMPFRVESRASRSASAGGAAPEIPTPKGVASQ